MGWHEEERRTPPGRRNYVAVQTANSSEMYCSRFGSSNSNDYISLINLLADFYNTVATRRFLAKSLHDFLYTSTQEPLQ